MDFIFQSFFILVLIAFTISGRFKWKIFFLLSFLSFILSLLFPKELTGLVVEDGDNIFKKYFSSSFLFIILYFLPGFCVLKIRQMFKVKVNIVLDLVIQYLLFLIFMMFFYLVFYFYPISYIAIKTTGVGP